MCKVLVIEDDYSVRDTIREALELQNYETVTAENGLQALEACKERLPDLIISDIGMPYMDGFEVLQAFQKNPATSSIPFIFLSGRSDNSDIRSAMNSGADDYLIKPFKIRDLLTAIDMRLKKKKRIEELINKVTANLSRYLPHELRTPLVPIIGYSDLLLKELERISHSEMKDMINDISISGNRLHKTIEKFIALSELSFSAEGRKQKMQDNVEITSALFDGCLKSATRYASRVEDFRLNIAPGFINIRKYHLIRLLEEIIENAIEFSSAGSLIELSGAPVASGYKILVKDYGCGISKEELASFRDLTHSGNGLGLVIVTRIVNLYEGYFKIESEKDKYTIVSVTLPAGVFNDSVQ